MSQAQDHHERAVGETFIASYNAKHRMAFKLIGRVDELPDLVFRDGDRELCAHVTTAYYDPLDAQFKWTHARARQQAPKINAGFDFERELIRSINDEIAEKCGRNREPGCILLISVHPTVTTATMLREVLGLIVVPALNPFEGVYVAGNIAKLKRIGQAETCIKQLA